MKPKNITKEEYIKVFCRDMRIRDRKAIYIRADIHDYLQRLVPRFKGAHVSLSSLVTMILIQHIVTYTPLFRKLRGEEDSGASSTPKK